MTPEVPFFANRRKRAGLVRRIGNLAEKLPAGPDPDFAAMHMIATHKTTPKPEAAHLKEMMAGQLEFVSPLTRTEARLIAQQAGVAIEYVNQTNYKGDIKRAPETMRAAFVDIAALARRTLE
jgi:hypothetical protein